MGSKTGQEGGKNGVMSLWEEVDLVAKAYMGSYSIFLQPPCPFLRDLLQNGSLPGKQGEIILLSEDSQSALPCFSVQLHWWGGEELIL